MNPHAKTLNIDWLQLNCRSISTLDDGLKHGYTLKHLEYGTRHFKNVTEIYFKHDRIATVAFNPASKILNPQTHLIKFDNKQLYRKDLQQFVKSFLIQFNLTFHNFSRIDIALDFSQFDNDTQPHDFIRRVVNGQYLKYNKAEAQTKFTQDIKNSFSYLKFGSNSSDICFYIYNKSLELKQVKHKPWITDNWKANGLDTSKDIYRLEFSIKAPHKSLINLFTGELSNPFTLDLLNTSNTASLFNTLVCQYFRFKFKSKQRNKARMNNIPLFDNIASEFKLLTISNKLDSGRSDKIFIKKLNEVNDYMRGNDFNLSIASDQILEKFIVERDLVSWSMRKGFFPNI